MFLVRRDLRQHLVNFLYFLDGEADSERLRDLPKDTQLVSTKPAACARTSSQCCFWKFCGESLQVLPLSSREQKGDF